MIAPTGQDIPLHPLQRWYRTPLGRDVARLEGDCVERLLRNTFGYYLVQLGATESFACALEASRIRHRILVAFDQPATLAKRTCGTQVFAYANQLPLASDSVDALLLPHTLDFCEDPKSVLSEVERVLIPEGRVIIIGFNAMSLWGVGRLLARRKAGMPWCGRFHTASQVEDWLSALGCDREVREFALFCPPFGRTLGIRCTPFDAVGRRFWPIFGGIYVIRAVKRVSTLTPLKPLRTRPAALLAGGAVRPSTRRAGHA